MISESALTLLLARDALPELGRRGGVLTPMTAMGDALIERLEKSGRVTVQSEIVPPSDGEDRKTR